MNNYTRAALAASTAAFLIFAGPHSSSGSAGWLLGVDAAHAQADGGHGGGGQGSGGSGGGSDGHGGGSAGQGGQGGTNSGGRKGGASSQSVDDSEGKGPKAGQSGKVGTSGKPAWAAEGIPEVELGRLSVARSPDKVLDRALAEVLANWSGVDSALYSMTAAEFSDYVAANWDTITIVDSPLQNLALMDALFAGTLNLDAMNIDMESKYDLAAMFLGVASDKTVPITVDTVAALNVILGLNLGVNEISVLATKAEDVRLGVVEGHG